MIEDDLRSLLPDFLVNSETYYAIVTDLEGRYIYVNPFFEKRYSFLCKDFIGKPSFIAIHPDDHDTCSKAVNECFENPGEVVKTRLRKPDTNSENFYWTEWEFSLFKDREGVPIGIFCLGHDITDTELASKEARELTKKIDAILDEMTDGCFIVNRDWECVKVNAVAEKILDCPRHKLEGRTIWEVLPVSDSFTYPQAFRKAMKESVKVTFEDYQADLDRWFSVTCYPSQEGLTVFFQEITQSKKHIETITQQEYILDAIYQSTTESSFFIDRDFTIKYGNQGLKNVTKQIFGRESQIGENALDYFLPEYREEFKGYYHRVLMGEKFLIERSMGEDWWQISLNPVLDKDQKIIGIANNVLNITERKTSEMRILKQNERLKNIAWQHSHELRGPVTQILGLIDLIKNELGTSSEEDYQNYLSLLSKATTELDKVIHKIVVQSYEKECRTEKV